MCHRSHPNRCRGCVSRQSLAGAAGSIAGISAQSLSVAQQTLFFAGLRPEFRPAALFVLLSGCTLKDCVNLRWQDVNFEGQTVNIHGLHGTKTVQLSVPLRELLTGVKGHHDEYVFTSTGMRAHDGGVPANRYRLNYSHFSRAWGESTKAAGLTPLWITLRRRDMGSLKLRASEDPFFVRYLLGGCL